MSNVQLLNEVWKRLIKVRIDKVFEENSDFTGQITIEIHCKAGIIKDVYVSNRSKIDN